MSTEIKKEIQLEIAHVLFIDIVGYSKLLIHEQSEHLEKLREIVRATEQFRSAQAEGKLLRLPTGDGGALVFRTSPEAAVACALEIGQALKNHPQLRVRMGIHSGPVRDVTDLNEQANIAGAGINIAQRVMDCADAGHILLSKRVADDLEQYARWRPLLHELGTCEVKHGTTLSLVNLYSDEIGNPEPPKKFKGDETREKKPSAPILRKSIAVLPFENLSEDKANAYFADGIQEEILTRLSRIGDLKVISRTSTQRFKNSADNIAAIAHQLGVANILEGSVRKAGNRVRVHVQLIDAESDAHLWAERYDRELIDIFAVESDIAAKIAEALQARLSGAERRAISAQPTTNTEAHELYLKGRHLWRNFYAPGYEKVRDYFQQAVELDPSYAPAYAGLSLYYSFGAANGILPPDVWPQAEIAANKALEFDETLGEAINSYAAVEIYYKRNWPAAERAFHRGAELNPNFADIRHHYGLCLILFGRGDEALRQVERANQLDPFFPGLQLHTGRIYFLLRDYDRARRQFAKTLDLHPGYAAAHEYFGDACQMSGMPAEAIIQWRAALALSGEPEQARLLEETFAASGLDAAVRALAREQLEQLKEKTARGEHVPAYHYMMAYMRLGDTEQAFSWMAKTVEERSWFALQLGINPLLDPLRSDPRFQSIAASLVIK
jgi:TolB-like protein/class 3 adenylate cyclase/Tfp pilus assembly protein PilF